MRRFDRPLFILLCLATLLVVIGAIAFGPGDLYEKDQPKTIAYTADVVLHGRYALPRDVLYQPATKPPLYNWIGAAVVVVTRSWSELALKMPSVLGAIGIAGLLFATARSRPQIALLAIAMFAAFGIDVRHGSTMRLAFLARPDMLQAFFVTLAWFAATRVLLALPRAEGRGEEHEATSDLAPTERAETRDGLLALSPYAAERGPFPTWAILFWLGVIGAILTKGPLALLLFVYVAIAAKLLAGRWSAIRGLRPIVGSLATVALVGAWLFFAFRTDPAHVRGVMLGAEIVDRVASQTPEGLAKPVYFSAMWFLTKGGPIAMLAAVGGAVAWWTRDRILRAASLWLIVLLVGLSLPAGKRIDYLLPTYAPAAILAAWLCVEACRRLRLPIALAACLPLALAAMLAAGRLTKFGEAQERWTDRTADFVDQVRRTVGDDALLVLVRGKHPIPTLLGRHQGSLLTPADLRAARWAILPTDAADGSTPTLVSQPVPSGFEVIEDRPLRSLGLYDLRAPDAPSEKTLADAQRACGAWTAIDNPYRAPDTVWRDD